MIKPITRKNEKVASQEAERKEAESIDYIFT